MADEIETAFSEHFERTSAEPSGWEYAMRNEGSAWDREGDEVVNVIADAAEIDAAPAEDIRVVLYDRNYDRERAEMGDEGPFDAEACYVEKGPDDIQFQLEWSAFENGLKTEARFFSRSAEATLGVIFEGIAEHKTREGSPVVVEAGPERKIGSLFRARVFQSDDEKLKRALMRPDQEVGPPPPHAAAAGRMNARGISVFYGAKDAETALAEIRPPVGSRVIVGRFEIIHPIRLLDVEALRSVFIQGSIFDRSYIRKLERAKFLGSLSHRITSPVMPDDEPFEYLVTQAIADYLATEARLDGLIYRSVQVGHAAENVALFHHASVVEPLDLPKGTTLDAHLGYSTEDGDQVHYWVSEKIPAGPPPTSVADSHEAPHLALLLNAPIADLAPKYPPTLRLDLTSVAVHHVSAVKFSTTPFTVTRHRT
jgi:hypothetical protein